ncbi:hypothetical protein GGR20_002155 [Devosia subaequoris]|uniref:Uncharacterized protein n=1 Tax=Devosia subaequoris TaxID=395930 RepID=A0A7W6NBY7_9HYPH|nr:hypothetical protein [Devosia subaequoris]MBB4052512.1 hypothetical protein [Devosia subaequoris]MCP1209670.1 hypothetical protein [Devosia subaequoris]
MGPVKFSATIFGREVKILREEDWLQVLQIDGRRLLSGGIISIDLIDQIKNVPYALGWVGLGGSGCPSSPFILSFPKKAEARLDEPDHTGCSGIEIIHSSDNVVFYEEGLVGDVLRTWTWTPELGFSQFARVAGPTDGIGWDELRSHALSHPKEILEGAEFFNIVAMLLDEKLASYADTTRGIGTIEYRAGLAIATSCMQGIGRACELGAQITVADINARALFIAFKRADQPLEIFPLESEWTDPARSELESWAAELFPLFSSNRPDPFDHGGETILPRSTSPSSQMEEEVLRVFDLITIAGALKSRGVDAGLAKEIQKALMDAGAHMVLPVDAKVAMLFSPSSVDNVVPHLVELFWPGSQTANYAVALADDGTYRTPVREDGVVDGLAADGKVSRVHRIELRR